MNQDLGAATNLTGDGASLDEPVISDTFRLLLEKAARVYDRHEAGRRVRWPRLFGQPGGWLKVYSS